MIAGAEGVLIMNPSTSRLNPITRTKLDPAQIPEENNELVIGLVKALGRLHLNKHYFTKKINVFHTRSQIKEQV